MEKYSTLLYEVQDHLGVLTLNRPERVNAMSVTMVEELNSFWRARRHDQEARVIILTGAGEKGLCSGLDLKEAGEVTFNPEADLDIQGIYRLQVLFSQVALGMRQAPQPIIVTCFGAMMGGGLSLALAGCVRLASPDARFVAQYINIGTGGADVGSSYFLPRLIGAGRAYEFLLTGDDIDAETAYRLGLVSRIVPRERLMDEARAMAAKMLRKSPLGLRMTKEAINCNLDAAGLEQALHLEDRNQTLCMTTIRYEGQSTNTK